MKNISYKAATAFFSALLVLTTTACNFNLGSDSSSEKIQHTIVSKSDNISFNGQTFQKTSFATVIPKGTTATIPGGRCTNCGDVFLTGRTVILSSYEMSQCEVTEELYKAVMGSLPAKMETTGKGEISALRPVVGVLPKEAFNFCNKLSELMGYESVYSNIQTTTVTIDMTKNGYRLPTEAEWEYAARGAGVTAADWKYAYAGSDKIKKVAWCVYNSSGYSDDIDAGFTHEVGIKQPNAIYLYDMTGNAKEWCQDYSDGNAGTGEGGNGVIIENIQPQTDPYLAVTRFGDGRVVRGGSYLDSYKLLTREHSYSTESWRSNEIGIRLVRRPN